MQHFVEDFGIYVHQRYWSAVVMWCVCVCVCVCACARLFRVILHSQDELEWVGTFSLSFCVPEGIVKNWNNFSLKYLGKANELFCIGMASQIVYNNFFLA